MSEAEILEKTKALSIEQRLHIIQAIWQTIDRDMQASSTTGELPSASFGESIVAFRQKHNIEQLDLDPDEIWGNVRDKSIVGQEVSFE